MPSATHPSPPDKSRAGPEHDLTAAFPTMDLETPSAIPTSGQCLDHLKLLEAFHVLREDVATTDGLYGIHDRFVDDVYPSKGLDEKEAQLLFRLREKRWAIFVANAERRYTIWFQNLPSDRGRMPGQLALAEISGYFEKTSGIAFDSGINPPLGWSTLPSTLVLASNH